MSDRLRCRLGKEHKPPRGYGKEGAPYLRKELGPIDGMGTLHVRLYGECQRCGREYHIANIHLNPIK